MRRIMIKLGKCNIDVTGSYKRTPLGEYFEF